MIMKAYFFFCWFAASTWQSTSGQGAQVGTGVFLPTNNAEAAPSPPTLPLLSPSIPPTPNTNTELSPSDSTQTQRTRVPSIAPTLFPTVTRRPSDLPSMVPTTQQTFSNRPSRLPSQTPSLRPTFSVAPSLTPSASSIPSDPPSEAPTDLPSTSPSNAPTDLPSVSPTDFPTVSPRPSKLPSLSPSLSPHPSNQPSSLPTFSTEPSVSPSQLPSESSKPSQQPSLSAQPSVSGQPSSTPSDTPSDVPSVSILPSLLPSASYAPSSSSAPSDLPSNIPSDFPSNSPTVSSYPSASPSISPSALPSISPSAEPSSVPSALPTFTPVQEVRDVGMYVTGLVGRFQKGTIGRQFEQLVSKHTLYYWETVVRGGTVVYNVNTEFVAIRRPPRGWRQQFLGEEVPLLGGRRARQPQKNASFDYTYAKNETIIPSTSETAVPEMNDTFTFAPSFEPNRTYGNETSGNQTDYNRTNAPTFMPTISNAPSEPPSQAPSLAPSVSAVPSPFPTATYEPSNSPTILPEPTTWVIWYTQNITYGERFTNETRANDIWEVFSFPFLLDQKVFTNEFINITNNQLAMYVVGIEVRDGSEAPSIQPSTVPSGFPSQSPTRAPTVTPTPQPVGGIGTTGIIVAVVVPVMVVLLIAFAGIIYVTRVEHEDLEPSPSYGEEVVLPVLSPPDPGTPPGNVLGSAAAGETPDEHTSVSLGTPATEPLIDSSEILQAAQQQQQLQHSDAPPGEVTTTPRRPSGASLVPSGSAFSEITSAERTSRRIPGTQLGTPGYMSATGTFTPSVTPIPFFTHSREPSLQGSELSTPASRSGLARAQTTGGIETGRLSPFQGVHGGIPTIPTAQLGVPDIAAIGGEEEDTQIQDTISESEESESNDIPSMTAFNLQIQDLDDF